MYSKDRLKDIKTAVKNLIKRTGYPRQVSVHFGRVDDKELEQIKELFPGIDIRREVLGYMSFNIPPLNK